MQENPSEDGLFGAITDLALQIARCSPEVADKAMQIVDLLQELRRHRSVLDRALVHDVLEGEALDTDWSDSEVDRATDAIVKGLKGENGRG